MKRKPRFTIRKFADGWSVIDALGNKVTFNFPTKQDAQRLADERNASEKKEDWGKTS